MGSETGKTAQPARKQIEDAMHRLAAKGLIYNTGKRRDGLIVWDATPGKEVEATLLERATDLELRIWRMARKNSGMSP